MNDLPGQANEYGQPGSDHASSAGTEPGIAASGRVQAGRGSRRGGAGSRTGKDSKKVMLASSDQALRRPRAARAVSMSVR
jgi:hypothetical protein